MMQSHYYKLTVTKYLKSKNDNMKCKWQNDNQHGNKNDSIMKCQNLNDKITENTEKIMSSRSYIITVTKCLKTKQKWQHDEF